MAATGMWRAAAVAGLLSVTGSVFVTGPASAARPDEAGSSTTAPGKSKGDAVGSTAWGDIEDRQAGAVLDEDGSWAQERDLGSMYSLTVRHGIRKAWARGMTGKGVTVAVIDTGIAPVAGLDADRNRVVDGPDLSFEGQSQGTRYFDGFGHGTHLAGIIAGRDPRWSRKRARPRVFAGVAPEAQLLNVKVGAADGGADVSQVIAALDWVVEHRRDAGMNVRVISLAYGTASPQPWQVDPLAHAVENAWDAGIVVVASAGNDGLDAPTLLMPAVDPHIIAVGALDPMGTPNRRDDAVAPFTSGGNDTRRPDVLAPGRSLVSLRVPGSYADVIHPEGAVQGDGTRRFFRGSGTSQATAFVAGQVALLLDKRPKLDPDEVKALLVNTADPLRNGHPAMGAGVTDVLAAATARVPRVTARHPRSKGTGSLELSRGGEHVIDPLTGTVLTGEVDVLGAPWDAESWAKRSASHTAWQKGTWNGSTWTGDRFGKQRTWRFTAWTGQTWGGVPWESYAQSVTWEARSWRGDSWEARSWREASWLARSWRALF